MGSVPDGERIVLQRRHIVHDPGPQRIEMDAADHLPQIRVLLAKNGFVAVIGRGCMRPLTTWCFFLNLLLT